MRESASSATILLLSHAPIGGDGKNHPPRLFCPSARNNTMWGHQDRPWPGWGQNDRGRTDISRSEHGSSGLSGRRRNEAAPRGISAFLPDGRRVRGCPGPHGGGGNHGRRPRQRLRQRNRPGRARRRGGHGLCRLRLCHLHPRLQQRRLGVRIHRRGHRAGIGFISAWTLMLAYVSFAGGIFAVTADKRSPLSAP